MTNVGREYSIALFEAAYEDGSLDAVRDDFTEIRKLLKKEPDYISFLMNPGIPKEERLDSLSEAFEDNVEQLLYSFLAVMTTNNHLNEFFTAAKEFEKMYEDYKKMSFAVITSAVKLTDEEKRKIVTRLRKVTGKAIFPVYKIDPSIVGGITITCDGKFFDGSVVRNLKNIKEAIS